MLNLIDSELKAPPNLNKFFLKYQQKEDGEDENESRLAPDLVPERPWLNVGDDSDEDLDLEGENNDTRRQVDGGEG